MSNDAKPSMTVHDGVASLTFPTDDYTLSFGALSRTASGSLVAEVTARHGDDVLHLARIDLLNQRDQYAFHQRCLSVNGTAADWQSRLQSAIPALQTLVGAHGTRETSYGWEQATTAEAFCQQQEEEMQADVRDLVIPGCTTLMAAPRASGKTIVALALGLALATGGVFRGERLPRRRVLVVDRDNPPALIRKRLRALGGQAVSGLKLLTRDKAPPLTDAEAWAACPVEDYDVIIIDSIGAATEGVSEKEGKQTQEYLATLKDLAARGPAVLALDNTNKAAQNIRGRGEKGDAVDILYECRNITGWTPTNAGDWWEDLPDFGEHTWQQRASRRKGQQVLRLAFVPSKFRLAAEPEPFVLEIDTRVEPWALTDVTEEVASAGQQAAESAQAEERWKIEAAERALVEALKARPIHNPMLKSEAEIILCAHGLKRDVARTLLTQGGNREVSPHGPWFLRPLPGVRGKPFAVDLAGEEDLGVNNHGVNNPTSDAGSQKPISADGSTPHGENTPPLKANESAGETDGLFSPQPGCDTAEIDIAQDEYPGASLDGGIISAEKTHTSDNAMQCGAKMPAQPLPTCRHDPIHFVHVRHRVVCQRCLHAPGEETQP